MPVCPKCGFNGQNTETCERCGGPIHRLLSAAPFILKGEGWYVTDYPSESRKKAKGAEADAKESATKDSAAKDSGTKVSAKISAC